MKNYRPKGIQSLVPFLYLKDVPNFILFAHKFLNAEIIAETKSDEGITYYATLNFDGTTLFVQEVDNQHPLTAGSLYLYVPDTDAVYKSLINAGAISISKPETFYHGDRFATVQDKWENFWYIATAKEDLKQSEVQDRRKNDER